MSNASSITKIFMYRELLDRAIRTSAHPAHIHEMERKTEGAVQEAMNSITLHNHEAMEFFGVEKIVATQLKSLVDYCFQGDVPYVPADERFLD
jgi:hypothetical protein